MDEELEYFNNQLNETADYFEKWLYPTNYELLNNLFGSEFKKDIFSESLSSLSHQGDEYKHNCIPCNLATGANLINQLLSNHRECRSIQYFLNLYTILFYLQAERYAVVYTQIDYTQKSRPTNFDWKQFPVLEKIKCWANFFKHPKSAMFLHHPTYHIESYAKNPNFLFKGVINTDFVKKYYNGKSLNNELEKKLLNENYKIFFPDLLEFTKELCVEFEKLFEIINSNDDHIEKLQLFRKKTI